MIVDEYKHLIQEPIINYLLGERLGNFLRTHLLINVLLDKMRDAEEVDSDNAWKELTNAILGKFLDNEKISRNKRTYLDDEQSSRLKDC